MYFLRATCLTILLTATSAPATLITGSLLASYGSGNTTFDSNSQTLPNSPTASSSVTVGSRIASGAAAQANLPAGTLAVVGAASASTDFPADPQTYFNNGNASLTYQDTFTVQSSTLPAGTPVLVTIAAQLAFTQSATHTIPSNLDIHNNDATTQIVFSFAADSGPGGGGSFLESDQSFYDPVAPTTILQGIFATPHVQQIIPATVGSAISFIAELKTYNTTNVAAFSADFNPPTNQSASALASAAIALGFSATNASVTPALADTTTPDITLLSTALNQTMPSLDNASAAIAQSALLANSLPEPSTLALLLALPAFLRRRRI